MVVLLAVLFMAPPVVLTQEKQLLFEAPKDATEADRKEAAKALAARCVATGMAGVKGDAIHRGPNIPKQIRLLAPKAFTPEMLTAIDYFASFPARDLELRFHRVLTSAEKEEYPVEGKAPKGYSWVRLREWENVDTPFAQVRPSKQELVYLLPEKPGVKVAGQFKIHRHGGGDLFGVFNGPDVFLIARDAVARSVWESGVPSPDEEDKEVIPVLLLLDGHRISTEEGHFLWRILKPGARSKTPDMTLWDLPTLTPTAPLTYLLEHPLPFALKRIE